ncbi:MAG: rod shape-determining protein MreC [Chloroflexota bacterium]|nr:rod shape-determining protein MreC [Chloroflexota bacterium]
MKQFTRPPVSIRRTGERSWLPLVLLILGLLLLVLHESGLLAPVERATHYVLDPLQRLSSNVLGGAGGVFRTMRETRELRAEVEGLQVQVDALRVENVRLREYEAEAQELRGLLNFVSEYPISAHLGAEVITRDACETYPCGDIVGVETNPYLRYITINVGAQQGADVGMSVVSGGAGLVGRIMEVGPRTAKVQLLSDPDSAVAGLLQTTRATGLVVGQADGTLQMQYIPQEAEVSVGDIVLSSGLGGLMPKGLVIGQVTEVQRREYETFQTATVRPAVDFTRLELALVVTDFKQIPVEEAQSE